MADESSVSNSIDTSIEDCKNRIRIYESRANLTFGLLVFTIVFFGLSFYFSHKVEGENTRIISEAISQIDIVNDSFNSESKLVTDALYKISHMPSSDQFALRSAAEDSTSALSRRIKTILSKFESNSEKLKDASNNLNKAYSDIIFYGVFVLFFGVITSFYRYFLKEMSKYEHYLFAMHRIRIAANNHDDGFGTEVRRALTSSAFDFSIEKDSVFKRKGNISSPIPGHPSSDALTLILNKILEPFEFVVKQKQK